MYGLCDGNGDSMSINTLLEYGFKYSWRKPGEIIKDVKEIKDQKPWDIKEKT